jgi:CHRD domain-containing protein
MRRRANDTHGRAIHLHREVGKFDEFIAALRAEAAYANQHTTTYPGGEIRGQVTFSRNDSIKDN